MPDTDLRDRMAAAIRDNLKRRTLPPLVDVPGRPVGGGMGLTEFDLADVALAVVQPELEQLRRCVPLICSDKRHQAKVTALETELTRLQASREGWATASVEQAGRIGDLHRELAEARAAVEKWDELCAEIHDDMRGALTEMIQSKWDSECSPPDAAMTADTALDYLENDFAGQAARALARIEAVEAERDGAYRERAQLLAYLAARHESHIAYTDPDVPTWPVLTIEPPTGQMCWHINPADLDLFDHVPWVDPIAIGWDGHTTEEKYERLRELVAGAREVPDGPDDPA